MNSPSSNIAEYTVSELSSKIKRTMEDTYGYVRVRGELGRISKPSSGHVYLDLKDEKSVLSGVIWRGVANSLNIQPEQGLEVIATGKITTFSGQSKYQIIIDGMEPAGLGALMVQLEKRKKELEAEGLFAEDRKQKLPILPGIIGVVTSPSGAVIRDILHRVRDRFPLHVIVWPVRVQGENCGKEVAAAIRGFNNLTPDSPTPRPDIIIVARGGGSIEDLWGFNDEIVVRATAESEIPLISAVGHETDWTLIDFASDVRAPTPTGAAEIAIPVRAELLADVDESVRRLQTGLIRFLHTRRTEFRAALNAMPQPRDLLALPRQRFDATAQKLGYALQSNTQSHRIKFTTVRSRLSVGSLRKAIEISREQVRSRFNRANRAILLEIQKRRSQLDRLERQLSPEGLARALNKSSHQLKFLRERIDRAFASEISQMRLQLEGQSKLLWSLSYQSTLARGYTLVRDMEGKPVRLAANVSSKQDLLIQFADGSVAVTSKDPSQLTSDSGESENAQKKSKSKQNQATDDRQGRLL